MTTTELAPARQGTGGRWHGAVPRAATLSARIRISGLMRAPAADRRGAGRAAEDRPERTPGPPESESKRRYRAFCEPPSPIPIFSRDWWMDALVGPEGWDVALVEKHGQIVGSMVFTVGRRLGFNWSSHPPLTQILGPWVRPAGGKATTALAFEKDVLGALADALPPFAHFVQNWHHSQTNWLPFYWRGFSQTTRYTYVLPGLVEEKEIWTGMDGSVRSHIRKASSRFGLKVRADRSLDDFLPLNRMTYGRQQLAVPYGDALVRRLDAACAARNCRRILIAEDAQGRRHAGEYLVWDEHSAYCLMGGSDPELRNSGATGLCLWEAIRFASGVTQSFDFCGSMIESIERQFRAFGAERRPYFRVWKTRSRTLQAVLGLESYFSAR